MCNHSVHIFLNSAKIFYCKYFLCATVFHIYHFNGCIKLHPSVDYILLHYSPIIGHLGHSQVFCALNILMHMDFFLFVILFLGKVPRSGIARSKNMNFFMDLDFSKGLYKFAMPQ